MYNEPMAKHTTFKIGGPAEVFIRPSTINECIDIIKYSRENGKKLTVLGGCSNVLVRDAGIEGVVLCTTELKNISVSDKSITAEAGVNLNILAETACQNGLSGLAFASGIPGTVGGAVYMNAGAYGHDIAEICESVTILWKNGEICLIPASEMKFAYRYSVLQETSYKNAMVISAVFKLTPGDTTEIKNKMKENMQKRKTTQPLEYPSAGSTFKRPPGQYAGKLIADSGLKGYRIGGALVSDKHAGFVINAGHATADDVLKLIEHIQITVKEKFDVLLEPEIRLI
jgi:UDP-N-acetylmuramate dehydrogenase